MNISGYITDGQIRINFTDKAKALPTGAFCFSLKGLPLAWDKYKALKLIQAWARHMGFTHVVLNPTRISPTSWCARIHFYAPKFKARLPKEFACQSCGVAAGYSCRGPIKV